MSKKFKLSFLEKPLTSFDLIAFAVLSLFCFLAFEQGADIGHTAGSSIAYLNGHILDFYDYNVQFVGGNAYLPSTYILFAIWNIPLRLFDIVTVPGIYTSLGAMLWFKLLPVLFHGASAFILYKIALQVGMGIKKSKLCAYLFLTMPIGFFSQYIFGQYDIFTVFFMLLGILYYYKKDLLRFALFFGISLTFKYFPLFIFIPMLLLYEKRIWRIIKHCAIVFIPLAIEILMYYPSNAFRSGVFGFGANNYIFLVSFNNEYFGLSLFVVAWIVLCGYSFFKTVKDEDNIKWVVFFSNIVTFLLFGLSMWHPQWLLFGVPFWVLGSVLSRRFDIFMIIEFLLMGVFILYTTNYWVDWVDQNMWNYGIFGPLLGGQANSALQMRSLFIINNRTLIYSVFSGLLLVNALFKHPKYCSEKVSEPIDNMWGYARFRFLGGVAIFIIPAVICLVSVLSSF